MALFPLPVKADMSDRLKMPARVLQFGDGYEQTGLAGLNRQQTTWDIEVIISSAAQDALFNSFLLEHGQHKSFTWQSPRDTSPQLYRITGDVSSIKRNGGGSKPVFFSRRMQFKHVKIDDIQVYTNLTYVGDGDANGLVYFLGTQGLVTLFTNPSNSGFFPTLESSILSGYNTPASMLFNRELQATPAHTDNAPNQWFAFATPSHPISIETYTIRARLDIGVSHSPRSWVLEGSNTLASFTIADINSATWIVIDQKFNDATLNSAGKYYTIPTTPSVFFKYLRFRQTGVSSLGSNLLVMGAIEFYGRI